MAALAVLGGMFSILGLFSSIGLLATQTIFGLISLVGCLISLALAACGAGVIAYVYELQTKGKSDSSWSLQAGAGVGAMSIFFSIVGFAVMVTTISEGVGLAIGIQILFSLVLANLVPIGMMLLFVFHKQLK